MAQEIFRVKKGAWFNLPKLSRNDFLELMRSGVDYKSGSGFMIRESANIADIKNILERILAKRVYVSFNCAICNRETDCSTCEYKYYCPVETTGGTCICNDCIQTKDLNDYMISVKRLIQN